MLRTLVSAIIASSMVATPTFAASFLDKLPLNPIKKTTSFKQNLKPNIQPKKTANHTHFTDFSGSWTGTCLDNEGHSDAVNGLQIFNDESFMVLGDQIYPIGEVIGDSRSNTESMHSKQTKLIWSADRKNLEWQTSITFSTHQDDGALGIGFGKMLLSLNDNEELILAATFRGLSIESMEELETHTFNCTFHKE